MSDAHRALVLDCAEWYRRSGKWMVFPEATLGSRWLAAHYYVADLLLVRKTYRADTAIVEVKVNRSDLLRDIKSGKWRSGYGRVNRFFFATPSGLCRKEEIPPECGWMVRGKNGWRVVRRAPRHDVEPLSYDVMLSLLMYNYERWMATLRADTIKYAVQYGESRDGIGRELARKLREYNEWRMDVDELASTAGYIRRQIPVPSMQPERYGTKLHELSRAVWRGHCTSIVLIGVLQQLLHPPAADEDAVMWDAIPASLGYWLATNGWTPPMTVVWTYEANKRLRYALGAFNLVRVYAADSSGAVCGESRPIDWASTEAAGLILDKQTIGSAVVRSTIEKSGAPQQLHLHLIEFDFNAEKENGGGSIRRRSELHDCEELPDSAAVAARLRRLFKGRVSS